MAKRTVTTVAFVHADEDAARVFWKEIRERFDFSGDSADTPTRAFAVAAYDLFAIDEAIDTILSSDLADDEKISAISDLDGSDDPDAVLRAWEVTKP